MAAKDLLPGDHLSKLHSIPDPIDMTDLTDESGVHMPAIDTHIYSILQAAVNTSFNSDIF